MLVALWAAISSGCSPSSSVPVGPPIPASQQPATTNETIPQILARIDAGLDPAKFPYLNKAHAAQLAAFLGSPQFQRLGPGQQIQARLRYGQELLNGGQTEEAVQVLDAVNSQVRQFPEKWMLVRSELLVQSAIGYLRLAEEQNCCGNNNANSCLVPISRGGIHTKQRGSREAIKRLLEALSASPNDSRARWLLNLAYMTLGEYPGNVPKKWLLDPHSLGGEYPLKEFYNAAPVMGLNRENWAGGVAMEDFDGDGFLDLMISSIRPGGQLTFYKSQGDGTFVDQTKEAGLIGETGGLNFITTDYNNDGRPDVVVLRGGWFASTASYPLSLLRNDGGGHFTDVTIQSGLLTFGPTQTATAFDYNGDGNLDLFIGYETTPGNTVPCKLFRNNGNGTFTDVTQQCGLNVVGYIKAVIAGDFMRNGRPGIYISKVQGSNLLLRNDGPAGADKSPMAPWKFTEIGHEAGVDTQKASFACAFFDYDNDGWLDLYVGGYSGTIGEVANDYFRLPNACEHARLYHNNRNGTFTDVSKAAHLDRVILGMGLNFGDLDNDGWLDLYAGTGSPELAMLIPNRMFRNHDGKYFDEVTTTGDFGHLQKGHGIAFGDLNNNGDQDIFEVMGGALECDTARNCLYVNPGTKNHWITLQLTGVKSNRMAIGAEVCAVVATRSGEHRIYRTVGPGATFGNNPNRLEMGLGNATGIKQVEIRWPASGIQQTVRGLSMDRFYKVREGDPKAEPWTLKTFKLPSRPGT